MAKGENYSEEEAILDETFRHMMIRCHGIYTLFGVKPITFFHLEEDNTIDREKELEDFLQYPVKIQKKYRKIKTLEYREMLSYMKKKYSKEAVFFGERQDKLLWNFWYANWEKYTGERYFFLFEEDCEYGNLFVNTNEVIYNLYQYYDQYKEVIESDFSPETVIKELKQGPSNFWDQVFSSDYLVGLLFGYGEKSACLFKLQNKGEAQDTSYTIDLKKNGENLNTVYLKVEDLAIPPFKVFSMYDEQLAIFQRERNRIIDFYSGEDFLFRTLYLLKQQDDSLIDIVSGRIYPIQSHSLQ